MRTIAATLFLVSAVPVSAAETVEQCLDTSKHPTLDHRSRCLEEAGLEGDARAIPALHRLAKEIVAREGPKGVTNTDFRFLARVAGWVARKTDDRFLLETLRSSDRADQIFAIKALLRSLDELPHSQLAREELKKICSAAEKSSDETFRLEAERCLDRLLPPPDLADFDPKKISPNFRVPPMGKGGLGGKLANLKPARQACLVNAIRPGVEVCVFVQGELDGEHNARVSVDQSRQASGAKPRWVVSWLTEETVGRPYDLFNIPLGAHEAIPEKSHRVLGASGKRYLLFFPVVRSGKPSSGSRAVLAVFDSEKGKVSQIWKSQSCSAKCSLPTAELADTAGGKAVRIHLRRGDAAGVERVLWTEDRLEPMAGGD